MVRIGVVSVLYIVPASTLIACLVYEQAYREAWEQSFICSACRRSSGDPPGSNLHHAGGSESTRRRRRPDLSVFALKYLACLAVGITSGFWVWTRKTLDSWCRCGRRLCRCAGAGAPVDKSVSGRMLPVSAVVKAGHHVTSSVPGYVQTSFSVQQRYDHCNPSLSFIADQR